MSKRARVRATLREGRIDWYRIENRTDDTASVHIYDEIGYYGVTAADFVRDFSAIKARSVNLHVNSPGGEVYDGMAIFNAIRNHPARVTVRIDGLAASAASFIAMAGDEIVIEKNAEMMIHDALSLAVGNATELRELADNLDRISGTIAQMYADRAGGDVKQWRKAMKAETWYSADEAVAAGLADKVAGSDEEEARPGLKVAASFDLSIFRHQGREHAPEPMVALAAPNPEPAAHEGRCVANTGETEDGFLIREFIPEHTAECIVGDHEPGPKLQAAQGAFREFAAAAVETEATPPAFDPATLRAAVLAANEPPQMDTRTFREAMTAVALDAPAPPEFKAPPPLPEPEAAPGIEEDELDDEDEPPFDPSVLTAAVSIAANDAPAPPEPAPLLAEPEPDLEPEPVEPGAEEGPAFDPNVLTAALRMAAHDAPAPPVRTVPQPAPEPVFTFDADVFLRSLKEAKL